MFYIIVFCYVKEHYDLGLLCVKNASATRAIPSDMSCGSSMAHAQMMNGLRDSLFEPLTLPKLWNCSLMSGSIDAPTGVCRVIRTGLVCQQQALSPHTTCCHPGQPTSENWAIESLSDMFAANASAISKPLYKLSNSAVKRSPAQQIFNLNLAPRE